MLTGGCHCGAVRFELNGDIHGFKHCHCNTCRKIHGTVFGSSAVISSDEFKLTTGDAGIARYESSPGKQRCFCKRCGSHVFAYYDRDPSTIVLRLGTVDKLPAMRPVAHIWVSQKASWYEILDEVPQFPEDYVER